MPEPEQINCNDITTKLIAVYSAPRFGPLDVMFDTLRVVACTGIKVIRRSGMFWGHSLTNCMVEAMRLGAEYILTIDYDAPHELQDIVNLFGLMQMHPEADAICPLQMRRESNELLIVARDGNGNLSPTLAGELFQNDLIKVARGHFGLTILRAAAIRDLPKPWLDATPDERGEWGPNRTDEDVHFWKIFEAAGKSLYCAHRVVVGHMELVRTYPSKNLRPLYQPQIDYEANGKPKDVWGEE